MSGPEQDGPDAGGDLPDRSGRSGDLFADLARLVYAPDSIDDVYQQLCQAAPHLVTGCDHASLMLLRQGRFATAAANDDTARRIDEAERNIQDGPCVDAILEEAPQLDPDLTRSSAWPKLAEWITEHTPVRGAMAYRLWVDDAKAGALNLFADEPGALTAEAAEQGAVLAAFASVTLAADSHRDRAETLRAGLHSNREIGKAIGLLMAFHKINEDDAFAMLRKTSQDLNIKVAEVAKEFLDHHRNR